MGGAMTVYPSLAEASALKGAAVALGKAIAEELSGLAGKPAETLRSLRAERFLRIGA